MRTNLIKIQGYQKREGWYGVEEFFLWHSDFDGACGSSEDTKHQEVLLGRQCLFTIMDGSEASRCSLLDMNYQRYPTALQWSYKDIKIGFGNVWICLSMSIAYMVIFDDRSAELIDLYIQDTHVKLLMYSTMFNSWALYVARRFIHPRSTPTDIMRHHHNSTPKSLKLNQ